MTKSGSLRLPPPASSSDIIEHCRSLVTQAHSSSSGLFVREMTGDVEIDTIKFGANNVVRESDAPGPNACTVPS